MKNFFKKYFSAFSVASPLAGRILKTAWMIAFLCLFAVREGAAQKTIYAVVYGNQSYFVGSSTQHSGLFRSTDSARTWRHLGTDNLKAYAVDAVDESRGRILYMGAGDGVHRSTDHGHTWKTVTDWRMTEVLDVKVDQRVTRYVYAATAFGLWRSEDGGDTWTQPDGPMTRSYVYRVSMDMDGYVSAFTDSAVYRSRDYGTSWSVFMPMPTTRTLVYVPPGRFRTRSWVFGFGTEILQSLLTDDFSPLAGERRYPVSMNVYGLLVTPDTTVYPEDVDMIPADQSTIYAVGDDGVRSSRLGSTPWKDITGNLPNRAVHAIAGFGSTLLIGTFGDGLFRREGEAWVASGLEGSQIWSITVKDY